MDYRHVFDTFSNESYLDDGTEKARPADLLDCSLGVNPFGHPEIIDQWMKDNISRIDITEYPGYPYMALKAKIADYLKDEVDLDAWNIGLSVGSMGVLVGINRMFVDPGCKVLMNGPTFSSYETDVKINGGIPEYVYLRPENKYKFDADEFCSRMTSDHRLFYLDNPNNPTGQAVPVGVIEKCVKKALDLDRAIVIDEAYGDFMERSNSAAGLLEKYRNLIVVKSFSKGFGLAGLRCGYAMMDLKLAELFNRANIEMSLNEFAYRVVSMALEDVQHIENSRNKIAVIKRKVIDSITKLNVSETTDTVPIMLLTTDRDADLSELFLKHGAKTEAGKDFTGVGRKGVRVRVPANDRLADIIREIEAEEDV
ncbi:MAG: histidinol-phosphate transaminase [Anaerovoracaceae bacterium]|nr:histidinol-phosphate transaminase [Anaerovoracaceae bacterium]